MPRCGCNQTCSCAVEGMDTLTVDTTVSGTGAGGTPYVVMGDVRIAGDPATGGPNLLRVTADGLLVQGDGGCACFMQHRQVDISVPLNTYVPVPAWDSIVTCGVRPADPLATTILQCQWRVNISDYSDDSTPPNPAVRFGYGVYCSQGGLWIAGSHGFIEWEAGLDSAWMDSIADLPEDIAWPDALTSGSFSVPINVSQHGFPVPSDFEIAAVLGLYNPSDSFTASFHIETYEYALCGCACQE